MTDVDDETKEQRGASFADKFFAKDESGFNVEIVAATHVGKVRQRNEDHFAVIRRTRRCELLLSNLLEELGTEILHHISFWNQRCTRRTKHQVG